MVCRTLTEVPFALFGDSTYRYLHSVGENGEWIADPTCRGSDAAESGIRRCCKGERSVTELGVVEGDSMAAERAFGAMSVEKDVLTALDGTDVGEGRYWLGLDIEQFPLTLDGLEKTGENVRRNSVYAGGGEIGVRFSPLCFDSSPDFSWSSDGKVTVFGVLSRGRAGFDEAMVSHNA